MNIGLYGYLAAASAYGFFSFLLMFSWRQSLQAKLLVVVMLCSTLWALASAKLVFGGGGQLSWDFYYVFETARYIVWYVFLLKLFAPQKDLLLQNTGPETKSKAYNYRKKLHKALFASIAFASIFLINELFVFYKNDTFNTVGHVVIALIAVVILEQVFRNSSVKYRWAIKYLMIGAGSVFAFDFYLYADGLLFRELDKSLWQARGFIHLVAVPLLAISAARTKNWSLNLFVSRDVVLNSTAIIGAGVYLLLMSIAGFYLREFGGDWGQLGRVVLFSFALIVLASVLFSGQLRAKIRVFLGKHFYKNKYDYRIEWLRLTEELNVNRPEENHYEDVIKPLAQIIEARAGMLWMADSDGGFSNIASWHCPKLNDVEAGTTSFILFMQKKGFVINIKEVAQQKEYEGLALPHWMDNIQTPWIVVPLMEPAKMFGFILLAQPLVERSINWEDRDLLKTAARQVSGHLMILKTSAALAQSKQFEVFSRLSAYMVHDLKNIAAELQLVADNAKRHGSNQAFLDDAFETVEYAASDIQRLLEQLRNRKARDEKAVLVNLFELVSDAVAVKQGAMPKPVFLANDNGYMVAVESRQLKNVLAHLIDNAQQATADEGLVEIDLLNENGHYVISIKDNGHGMDEDFICHRLFKPFDTTKGNAGMGIGMYESQDFIRKVGGDILVESEPEKGSVISLLLPEAAGTGE